MEIDRIDPTHTCFDDALDYISSRIMEAALKGQPPPLHLILVHAICLIPEGQPDAGKPFVHAWVEDEALCWDAGIVAGIGRVVYAVNPIEYYRRLRPTSQRTRYNLEEVYEENKRTGHHGPWKPEYLALCRPQSKTPTASSSEADSSPTS
jgi:hypothetical protein